MLLAAAAAATAAAEDDDDQADIGAIVHASANSRERISCNPAPRS